MDWTVRRKRIFLSAFALFTLDLLLYAAALLRTPHIDPTSIEWCVYFFGGITINAAFLVLACFGSGWKRTTILLSGVGLAYCWISYIGIEVMKHELATLMTAIIDYKAGNLTSVVKALTYLGAHDLVVTQDPAVVLKAAKIVLPGVGHFRATQLLAERGLTEAVRESVARGTWFLGVCVGLQWLFEGSTEAPATSGLGHFPGQCERFPARCDNADLKSPHVGWNSLEDIREESKLLRGVAPGSFVYYTHSWRAPLVRATAAVTTYGGHFTAAVEQDNVMGVQFHPEKSAEVGLRVLKNFIEL